MPNIVPPSTQRTRVFIAFVAAFSYLRILIRSSTKCTSQRRQTYHAASTSIVISHLRLYGGGPVIRIPTFTHRLH